MKRSKLTDQEYHLVSKWTRWTNMDSVLDIKVVDDKTDVFYDFDREVELTLEEGFAEMADSIAYPFCHEGFTAKEAEILLNLLIEFGVGETVVDAIRNLEDSPTP